MCRLNSFKQKILNYCTEVLCKWKWERKIIWFEIPKCLDLNTLALWCSDLHFPHLIKPRENMQTICYGSIPAPSYQQNPGTEHPQIEKFLISKKPYVCVMHFPTLHPSLRIFFVGPGLSFKQLICIWYYMHQLMMVCPTDAVPLKPFQTLWNNTVWSKSCNVFCGPSTYLLSVSDTGQNRRFDRCILDWTSWTAPKEASLEGKVLDIFKRSK